MSRMKAGYRNRLVWIQAEDDSTFPTISCQFFRNLLTQLLVLPDLDLLGCFIRSAALQDGLLIKLVRAMRPPSFCSHGSFGSLGYAACPVERTGIDGKEEVHEFEKVRWKRRQIIGPTRPDKRFFGE